MIQYIIQTNQSKLIESSLPIKNIQIIQKNKQMFLKEPQEIIKDQLVQEENNLDTFWQNKYLNQFSVLIIRLYTIEQNFELTKTITAKFESKITQLSHNVSSQFRKLEYNFALSKDIDTLQQLYDFWVDKEVSGESLLHFKDICIRPVQLINEKIKQLNQDYLNQFYDSKNDILRSLVLIKLWKILNECPCLKNSLINTINECLLYFNEKNISQLINFSITLQQQDLIIASEIIRHFSIFSQVKIKEFKQMVQNQVTPEYVLTNWKMFNREYQSLNSQEQQNLLAAYKYFDEKFQKKITLLILKQLNTSEILDKLKKINLTRLDLNNITSQAQKTILKILLNICLLWSDLDYQANQKWNMTSDSQFLIESTKTLHSTQVFTILYIFEFHKADQNNSNQILEIKSKLMQLLTGEGKSLIFGILSSFFGYLGYNVDLICYSPYLSHRDQTAFLPLFKLLNIENQIHYSTIDSLQEQIINYQLNLRQVVKHLLEFDNIDTKLLQQPKNFDILLIDEVDQFFSSEFIGQTYNPSFIFQTVDITKIIKTIWESQSLDLEIIYNIVQQLSEYQHLISSYTQWQNFFEEEFHKMIVIQKLIISGQITRQYQVVNGKIGYKELDHLSFTTGYGYETMFQYFLENSKGNIPDDILNSQIGIKIICGRFSYIELPKLYTKIFGLTGTYESLHTKNKKFLNKYFDTFIKVPSLFLESKLLFDTSKNVKVEMDQVQYFTAIKLIINLREDRPVLIFFKDTQILNDFAKFMQFTEDQEGSLYVKITQDTQINTQSTNNLDIAIRKATHKGIISLIDKSFGRGTDFICDDKEIERQGGMIAVQTFFSVDKSEEIQIRGRTARQTKSGVYYLVLLADDLVSELSISKSDIEEYRKSISTIYQYLNHYREIVYGKLFSDYKKSIQSASIQQNTTHSLYKALLNGDKEYALNYLYKFNRIKMKQYQPSFHFIFLLDESDSMTQTTQEEETILDSLLSYLPSRPKEQTEPKSYRDLILSYLPPEKIQPKSNWEQVIESLRLFIEKRKQQETLQDRLSIIYYNNVSRIIAQYEQLQNVMNLLQNPERGNTLFIPALGKLDDLIQNEPAYLKKMKKIVLFLTDGSNQDPIDDLEQKMKELKQKYGKDISRWWNIKIGSGKQSSLKMITGIMNSQSCDSKLGYTIDEKDLVEGFLEFANCDKFNF